MTEKEAMTKPLHEVWEYFKSLQSMVAWPLKTKTDRMFVMQLQEEKKMLRRILLERCDNHRFEHLMPSEGDVNLWVEWHWAWELEQRRKEQEGGSHE